MTDAIAGTMNPMTPVRDAYRAVRDHEAIRRDAPEAVDLQPGDAYPQGDVIIARLDRAPRKERAYQGRQLVEGTTQGSRHVAEGDVTLYHPDREDALQIVHRLFPATEAHDEMFLGPVVVAGEAGWTVTHPEHGHRTFPEGNYQVVYQRAWKDEIRRQVD